VGGTGSQRGSFVVTWLESGPLLTRMQSARVLPLLAAGVLLGGLFTGCATTAHPPMPDPSAAVQDEAYVTVQPGVGSRVTRRVKASEVHKLREPGQQRARSEEELVHLLTPVASGVPSGGGGGSP